jgi:SAM-dependent methyltransferase
MATPATYSFTRYLAAKKSVDDRALNWQVWQSLAQALSQVGSVRTLQVLEVGAGIGTMVERLVEGGLLQQATYTAIDAAPEMIAEHRRRLPTWMVSHGFSIREDTPPRQRFQRQGYDLVVETEPIDLQHFVGKIQGQRRWDLLIAHAVLDLLDLPSTLPRLLALLRPGGLLYCSMVFDGVTSLQPEIDPALDAQIEALYHQTMDQRRHAGHLAGDSRSGRHVFTHLRALGTGILAAGSSDWIVFAGPQGYPGDEAYFLHFIIQTIGAALRGHPALDRGRLAQWIAQRQAQIEAGALVYIAHQLDVLARTPGQCESAVKT